MQALCLRAWAHMSAKLDWIRKIKVSMESGEHAGPVSTYNVTQAHKLACMHTIFLHAWTNISANLAWNREIKVFMKSGEYAGHV